MSLNLHEAPPPGARLAALVAGAEPVALRRPGRQLALYMMGAALLASVCVIGHLRRDTSALPLASLVMSSSLWALAVLVGAWTAIVPPSRQVLPSLSRSRAGALLALALCLATIALLEDGSATVHPDRDQLVATMVHCERLGLCFVTPLLALGWWLALRRLPMRSAAVGAAIGCASGALAGFVMHLICSIGGAAHALGGHVGLVLLGGALGASLARR